jgi:PQQ-dependent catabolism-associated CXXCW motif protein
MSGLWKSTKFFGIAVAAAALAFSLPSLAEEPSPAEPERYRLENYHAPTPATLKGATVIDAARTFEIWKNKEAVFIDTLARPSRPANSPMEANWQAPPRLDIPGSIWLPDTGFGELTPAALHYFEADLARATANDESKPLVFYCRANCWASWNAAKRALTLGYKSVAWYPGGADGWEKAGHPLEERQPEPMEPVGRR